MREVQGYPLPLGVQISKDRVNFSIAVPADKDCQLLLYRTGRKKPCRQFDMKPMIGEVRCIALEDIEPGDYEYNYLINKEVVTDPYVNSVQSAYPRIYKTSIIKSKGERNFSGSN